MAEYKFPAQVNYGWGLSLNMTGKAPAVAKQIFGTKEAALEYINDYNDSAIPGMILSVISDPDDDNNGLYFVKKIKSSIEDSDGNMIKIGSGNSIQSEVINKVLILDANLSIIDDLLILSI